jgi:predicted AAA+ superfamily ATPase
MAAGYGVDVFDLDDLATRDAVLADPALFAAAPAPVCVDEYHRAKPMLDAIKAELNVDLRPGRFVLTGSTRYDAPPLAAQALTGRLHLMTILPLSQGELAGVRANLVERMFDEPAAAVTHPAGPATKRDDCAIRSRAYVVRPVSGGASAP